MKAELIHTFEADRRSVTAVRYVDGGRVIVTGGFDGHVRRWDTTHWIRLAEVDAHGRGVTGVDVDLERDLLVTSGADKAVRAWALRDGRALYTVHRRTIARLDPTGQHLATITPRGRGVLHALETGAEVVKLPLTESRLRVLAWTPGGSALIGGGDGVLYRFHAFSGEVVAVHPTGTGPVVDVGFAPGDGGFATVSTDGRLTLWTTAGQPRVEVGTGGASPGELRFRPDGKAVAVSLAYQVQIRSTADGRPIARIRSVIKGMFGLDWSPDGRHLACAAADGRVRVWAIGEAG